VGRLIGLVVTVALLVGVGVWAWWFLVKPPPPKQAAQTCPTPSVVTPAAVRPASPRTVHVNVYNSTSRSGLAAGVAAALRARGFVVVKVANDPLHRHVTGVAEVRHAARGASGARTVSAHLGSVVDVPDSRKDATVDVVLGAAFTALKTPAQAAAALKAAPKPVSATPSATC
jgi:hypothetical protein